MTEAFTSWDAADHLKTDEDMLAYLESCAAEDPGDGSLIRAALGDIARAREARLRRYYPAIIDREGSHYGISFPDFPGCVSSGATPEEAIEGGREALAGHVDLMIRDGDAVPEPTPLEAVTWEEDEDVVCVALVPVVIPGH